MSRNMVLMESLIEQISMGPFGSDIKVENFVSQGIPVLNGSNISGIKLSESFSNYLTKEKADSLKKANAKRGDIVITHRGTLGQIAYIPENSSLDRYVISQSQFRVSLNRELVDPAYFSYYFHTNEGQQRLLSFKSHVGVPALAQATTNFRQLKFPLRPLSEQLKISNVLLKIDSKIELNNKINTELEAMAKLIYDYWFVQFDFPDKNGKPYKSSGGKMVYNEELKREIPDGWVNGVLNDLGEIVGGSTPSTADAANFCKKGTPWITPKDLSRNVGNKFISCGEQDVSDDGLKNASLKIYPKNTVLMSSRAPIGYMAIARNCLTTNQGFKSFIPNKGFSSGFIFYTTKHVMKAIIQYSSGSTFKEVSGSTLKTVKVCLPKTEITELFENKVQNILKRQNLAELENHKLKELRDWLLPMLMNGQVQISTSEL